jgi:hypothetical protein
MSRDAITTAGRIGDTFYLVSGAGRDIFTRLVRQ